MRCPQCQAINQPQAKHCVKCGTPLISAPSGQIRPGATLKGGYTYTIQRSLGQGGMGALYLAHRTIANRPHPVVIKEMLDYYDPGKPGEKERAQRRFEIEAATLASLSVAGIPQIYEYFSQAGRFYIVMQFIEGKNLESGLTHLDPNGKLIPGQPYSPEQVRQWGIEICRILQVLAGKNIVHMDIKPANLILDESGNIWLVDFGTVKAAGMAPPAGRAAKGKTSIYGTLGYAAPEQIAGQAEHRSDVYALAATLYHLLTDQQPPEPPDPFPKINRLPSDIAAALQKALTIDVRRRPTAAEFADLLQPPPAGMAAFRWQNGARSLQPASLAAMADQHWQEALEYLKDGDWEDWFRKNHQNHYAKTIRDTKARQSNPHLALDAVLRQLDPRFPAPSLHTNQTVIDAGMIPWRSFRRLDISLSNQGSGCLHGICVKTAPCLKLTPKEFIFHERCSLKLRIDTSNLTPSPQTQTYYLNLDAGTAGKLQIAIKFIVPEPELAIDTLELDFGKVARGAMLRDAFQVNNLGGSFFEGRISSDRPWAIARPPHFGCSPGSACPAQVDLSVGDLSYGEHQASIQVAAKAGDWEQVKMLILRLHVSPWKSFLKFWAPPLSFTSLVGTYGGFMGMILGSALGKLLYPLQGSLQPLLVGALLGGVSQMFFLALLGALGGISPLRGRLGLQEGAIFGFGFGAVSGAAAGLMAARLFDWLNLELQKNAVYDPFGALVGTASGLLLGASLALFSKKA